MKAINSIEYAPLGLTGHLRAAIEAWRQERAAQKATATTFAHGVFVSNDLSRLTAAELHEIKHGRSDGFAEAGDVLSALVTNWPTPSGRRH
ncbi:hypothetical protein HED22_15720 [Thalassospira sp. HF15]|nr:hypothetical protein [Thalassospira sp. HF15]